MQNNNTLIIKISVLLFVALFQNDPELSDIKIDDISDEF